MKEDAEGLDAGLLALGFLGDLAIVLDILVLKFVARPREVRHCDIDVAVLFNLFHNQNAG